MQRITVREETRENSNPQDKMIEFCSKRRMAVAILLLMSISVMVLVVENSVSMGRSMGTENVSENSSEKCSNNMKTEVLEQCAPCSQFDLNYHDICFKTGYKERVKCTSPSGEETTHVISCPKQSRVEERKFWIFEIVAAVVGLASYGVVLYRQKHLDKQLLEKVHKQVAAGV